MKNARKLINSNINEIRINHLWTELRQRQYYNTLHELEKELQLLVSLPHLAAKFKAKINKSLEKIAKLTAKMRKLS